MRSTSSRSTLGQIWQCREITSDQRLFLFTPPAFDLALRRQSIIYPVEILVKHQGYRPTASGVAVERARKAVAERLKAAMPPEPSAHKPALQRTKLLVRTNQRNLIVDAQDVVYATIDDGLITVVATGVEGESNYRTIEELQSNLDPDTFWRVHRSFLVNIHRIREVIPWFKSSFQLRMDDKKQTEIPVSRVQTKRLRALLKL